MHRLLLPSLLLSPSSGLLLPPSLLPPPLLPSSPPLLRRSLSPLRAPAPRAQSLYSHDGDDDIDWDEEVKALTRTQNRYFEEIKRMESPEMVREFAGKAPPQVQAAVKVTISQLLGNLPPQVAAGAITAKGNSLASLMFSMMMTGYMFRNAEYRRVLLQSIHPDNTQLPPVSGKVKVKLAEGLEADVDASSYMADLRKEVEALRSQLAIAKQKQEGGELALVNYIQRLTPEEGKQLVSKISPEVVEAMGQLVASILSDFNVTPEMSAEAPTSKVRELLIAQLVTGYKLRELEAREELKNRFWDQ